MAWYRFFGPIGSKRRLRETTMTSHRYAARNGNLRHGRAKNRTSSHCSLHGYPRPIVLLLLPFVIFPMGCVLGFFPSASSSSSSSSSHAFTYPTIRTLPRIHDPESSINTRSSCSFGNSGINGIKVRTRMGAFLSPSKFTSSVGEWIEKTLGNHHHHHYPQNHWYQNPLIILIGIAIGIFVAGIGQGAAAVLNFRKNYANAPVPKVPCHGVVLNNQTTKRAALIANGQDESPLRLLVIGDSLAVGVGQTIACTPVLPETIANVVSSTIKRPVFWTCWGETGASTPFILKMMNQPNTQALPDFRAAMERCTTTNMIEDDETPVQDFIAQGTYVSKSLSSSPIGDDSVLQKWQERLYKYRKSFNELYADADAWEPFDIIILITGANDLKSFFFPFLLAKEERDSELRDQVELQGASGLVGDIDLFINTITEKMERGWNKTLENIQASAAEVSEALQRDGFDDSIKSFIYELDPFDGSRNDTLTATSNANITTEIDQSFVCSSSDMSSMKTHQSNTTQGLSPLFVLPAMPIRSVPGFAKPPLSWLARPVFDGLNRKKQEYASSEGHIIFVDEPKPLRIQDKSAKDLIWDEKRDGSIFLSVQSILPSECGSIRNRMQNFYKTTRDTKIDQDKASPFVSPDTIHPTESGYNAWGQHIGAAIAKELQSTHFLTKKGR